MLRRWKSGLFFIFFTCCGLAGLIYAILQRLETIMAPLLAEAEKGVIDFGSILALSRQAAIATGSAMERLNLLLIICCWAGSIFHGYLSGRNIDQSTREIS